MPPRRTSVDGMPSCAGAVAILAPQTHAVLLPCIMPLCHCPRKPLQVVAASSLARVVAYPAMKRITGWPQVSRMGRMHALGAMGCAGATCVTRLTQQACAGEQDRQTRRGFVGG